MDAFDEPIAMVLNQELSAPKLRFDHDSNDSRLWKQIQLQKLRQHRIVCWCLPVAVSSFFIILLFGAASFLTHNDYAQINGLRTDDRLIEAFLSLQPLPVPIESWSINNESVALAPFLAPIAAADISHQNHWIQAVLKPIVMEIGVIALFQSLPLFKVIWTWQKVNQGGAFWVRLVASFRQAFLRRRPAASLFRHARTSSSLSSPKRVAHLVRRALDSIKRIYKRRSRLSAASDITHVMGDDPDPESNAREKHGILQNQ